jgi:hypothetical protein
MRVAPRSICVGWLDLGEDDQRRAREYLSQFNADNTLDELGFGALRDAFADVFFPATNTIMTRTRYLVFIPALCLVVEQEKLVGNAAARRLTQLENGLRESPRTEESLGLIGERAKQVIRRHRLAERLFFEAFGLELDRLDDHACKIEHSLSPEVTEKICNFLRHPQTCPHGSPIPRGACCIK